MGASPTTSRMTALMTALAVVVGVVFIAPAPTVAAATDWTVGPGGDYPSLTAALASGSVISGDRLLVAPGNYPGSLVIDRNLTIEADSGQFTIQGTGGSVVTVQPGVGVSIIGAEIVGGTGTAELVPDCGGPGGPDCTRAKGGGVLNFGSLTLTGTRVANNVVELPGDFVPNDGAGVYNEAGATLAIDGSSVIEDNTAAYQGGGIFNNGGVVVIDAATIQGNGVIYAGLLFENRGGGIFSEAGTVTITNSRFYENVAERDGGALAVSGGTVTVTDSEFGRSDLTGGNSTLATNLGLGAVLFTEGGTITFERVTAMGNDAGFGGVASLNGGTFNVLNSTFSGNHARQTGGAVSSLTSSLNVVNSTISSNTSGGNSGAIFSASDSVVTLRNATVYGNEAEDFPGGIRSNGGTTELLNTVLAGNISDASGTPTPDDCSDDGAGLIFSSGGHNVFGDISGCVLTTTTGDQTGVNDPGLGPLFGNGGATPTHHPLPGSPVIDAGNPAAPGSGGGACEPLDQRGVARPVGEQCDVGSIESVAPIQAAIDAAPAGGTVPVPAGTYPENLVIEKDLDLVGDGAVIVDGSGAGPVVSVAGATVLIEGLTLTNGLSASGGGISSGSGSSLALVDVAVTGNQATATGGGLHHVGNELSITGSTFSTNLATGNGGAIFTDSASLTSITDSTISDNESFDHGGGIYAAGDLLVENSIVELNRSGDFGGGIHTGSSAFVTGSLIDRNASSSRGGGIYVTGGLGLEHTTVVGNVSFLGGGVADFGAGPSFMSDSTISGNLGADEGGGLYKGVAGSTTLINVTIAGNDAAEGAAIGGGIAMAPAANGSIVLRSSLVAGNTANTFPDCEGLVGGTFNLLGAGDTIGTGFPVEGCGLTDGVDGNQVGRLDSPIDPLIGPLAANGGSHLTHALLAGSPAIDAGDPITPGSSEVGCTVLSQNGVDRAGGGPASCDIGAFELAAGAPISVAFAVDNPTPATGVSSIPASDVPAAALTRGATVNQASVIANTEIGKIVDSPINSIPINSIPINSIPINSIPINSIAGQTLDSILLMDVPVDGGWEALLEGSGLTAPVQSYTFLDAISDATVRQRIADRGLTLAEYGLAATPINSIPISAIALGAIPINSIPINSIPINSIALVEAWCDLLEGSSADCDLIGVDPQDPSSADGTNLISLSLAAAPINSIPINSIPINSIPINSIPINSIPINSIYPQGTPINSILLVGAPINSIPINAIDLAASPINSIPINSIPINSIGAIIDCSIFDCAAPVTFAQVPPEAYIGTFGQLMHLLINETGELDASTLADILAGLPADTSLADLLGLLMPPEEYPWQRIDLDASGLAGFSTTPGTVQYTATLDISTGTPLNDVGVAVTLPPGFTYVPGSTQYLPAPPAGAPEDPVVDGSELLWSIPGVADLAHFDLVFSATTGVRLGPVSTGLDATVPAGSGTASASAATSLQEAFEPNNTIAQATIASVDTIYVTHLSSSDDVDFYSLENVAGGSIISATLANLPADYDLVVYGPVRAPLRGEPERNVIGVEDAPLDLLLPDETQPEVIEDIEFADRPVVALSTSRGDMAESVTTRPLAVSGDYIIEVRGYNGAASIDPYTLRLSVDPGPDIDACTAEPPTAGTPGALPGSLPAGVNTLFLVNQQRYEATHGAAALADLLASLEAVADQPGLGVVGAVIPVEGDEAVAAAYSSLDGDPCSVEAANTVASGIAGLVDDYRDSNPTIEYVVIVGGDDQVPQFRLPDETRIANETGYASALRGAVTPQTAAFAAGMLLSDDPYGDAHPLLANGREIFVPELALGRLVETPSEIVQSLDRFLTFNGLLDPTTTTSAFVSGYDFLVDGSEAVASELDDTGRPVFALISEVWDRDGLIGAFLDGTHTLASVNAHFDHNRAQPADLASGFMTTGDVTGSGPDTLERAIVFSMGCHSGLSLPDVQIGGDPRAIDWAQTVAAQGATFIGNTGYGYGETDTVALSEELMRQFAGNLDGEMTVGQALQVAKQRYAGSSLAFGAYDDKVLMISTFYGLPFYRVGGGGGPSPAPSPLPLGFDTVVGLPTTNIDTVLDPGTDLVVTTGDRGSYYAHVGDDGVASTQVTPFRPIQPKIETDVTQGGGLVAHGALITGLQSTDVTPFDPVVARPVVDLGANEPEPIAPGVFPSALQTVNRFTTAVGAVDQLVLVPGQFRSTTLTTGIQRLFTDIHTTVFYGPATGDFTPPVITSSAAIEGAGTVTFIVDVADAGGEVRKVTVLFQDVAGAGVWTEVVLVLGSDGSWHGAAPATPGEKEFFVQAVDAAGNVAISSNKGELFLSEVATPPSGGLVALSGELVDGWYDGTATVTLAPPPGGVVAYDLDGSGLIQYSGPFDVTGEGMHTLIVIPSTGEDETVTIPIDAEPPVVTSPIQGAVFTTGQAVAVDFACSDAASGVVSCNSTLELGSALPTASSGSFQVTAVDGTGKSTTEDISYTVVGAPTAAIVGDPGTVTEGSAVSFDSGTPGATAWAWTATRDGGLVATGAGESFDFVAADDGDYVVTLTVTVDQVMSTSATVEFTAENAAPSIEVNGAGTVDAGATYTVVLGPVSDPGTDNAFAYDLDWGDGTVESVDRLGPFTHVYTSPGTRRVSVDVTDEDGTFPDSGGLDVIVTDAGPPMCRGKLATIVGTPGNDVINGTSKNDVIVGGGGNDTIDGGSGNDIICSGEGNDRIEGGAGNDTIDAGGGNNIIDGGAGNDTTVSGAGNDTIDGGAGNDLVESGDGAGEIDGGAGNDTIITGDGDDLIDAGAGNDEVQGGGGNDVIHGAAGNDELFGGAGDDLIDGGPGNDHLDGGPGVDILNGAAGRDRCLSGNVLLSCEVG